MRSLRTKGPVAGVFRMRRAVWALLLLAGAAPADGGFVSTAVPVVEIPDQQAILVWKDGRERLVIDTAHTGAGDLAWIVPLPAPPKIEPASPAVFRTLESVTMPALVERPPDLWLGALLLLAGIALIGLIPVRRILARALALFALLVAVAFAFFAVLIPKSSVVEVSVLSRGEAGSYETATLESVDAGALLAWLEKNGFQAPPEIRTGIEDYVRDGWVFAVARLKAGGRGGRAHPLSFEFDTKEPVYPMRLTGTQGRPLKLRLFVLSDRRARCDALATESCFETGPVPEDSLWWDRDEDEVRLIGQPDLLRIAEGATVLSTLTAKLGPEEMRKDLRISFENFAPLVPVVYSEDAARSGAATTAAWVALALLLPCCLAAWVVGERRKGIRHMFRSAVTIGRRAQIVAWCVAIDLGIVAGVVDYATTAVAETRGGARGILGTRELRMWHSRVKNQVVAAETAEVEVARRIVAEFWRGQTNPYDGGAVREEPSPGNYGFELRDGEVTYLQYDPRGTPLGPKAW